MKRKTNRLLAIFLTVVLAVSSQTGKVFAESYYVEDDFGTEMEESLSPYSVEPFEADKMAAGDIVLEDSAMGNEIIRAEAVQTLDENTEPETVSTIYGGTMTGYLSATDDYLLYPANLDATDYLQARLTLPNNSQIDYDLLLMDSNLSIIKTSDYVTYVNEAGTIEESIGYIAAAAEKVYVCVYSTAGGSTTEAYTLDYTITTNFTDTDEPSENAKEACALTLGISGANVTAKINSPIDNDWYVFEVLDSPAYEKTRFSVSSSSTVNGCKFELYRNLVTSDYYGMQYLGAGTGGEVPLPAGTYYLRIVSTNTMNNFTVSDIPTYELSVVPVSRVDEIKITEIKSNHGTANVDYPEGPKYRVDGEQTNYVVVKGYALYYDEKGYPHMSANAVINGKVEDQQWSRINRPDMAWVYSLAVTNSSGSYRLEFHLNPSLGGLSAPAVVSTHYYDLMEATAYLTDNDKIKATDEFYYLHLSVHY